VPQANLSDIAIEYKILGKGEPLLLVGGLGSQLISWDDAFCNVLVRSGYQVVRYDNRDSGLSTILEDRGVPDLLGLLLGVGTAPYLLDDMARDALALLDHLHIAAAHVVGLSMGGMIAQLLAMRHPERVASVVAALSGPPGKPSGVPAPAVVAALLRPPSAVFEDRVSDAVELRRALAGGGDGFDEVQAWRRAAAQIERAHHPAGTMRQAAAVLASPNMLTSLHQLRVPAMIVHGELDPLVPYASAEAAARAIPNALFVGIPNLGHDLPQDVAVDLIERIKEFHSTLVPSR
jgi:pimeloyl-ACP methyl ester carboxylesterase